MDHPDIWLNIISEISGWTGGLREVELPFSMGIEWVGIIQSVGNMNGTQMWKKGHWSLPSVTLGPGPTSSVSWVLGPWHLSWDFHTSFPGFPACRCQVVGPLRFHNHMSWFLTLYVYGFVSLIHSITIPFWYAPQFGKALAQSKPLKT